MNNEEGSVSTEALLNGDLDAATDSLIAGNVSSLMDKVHISHPVGESINTIRGGNRSTEYQVVTDSWDVLRDMLDPFFQRIAKFLELNGLSPTFLSVFKIYLRILKENNLDPLADDYLLCLQNELGRSLVMSSVLEELLVYFLIRPANMYISMALFEHKQNRSISFSYLKQMESIYLLKSQERKMLLARDHALILRILERWRDELDVKGNLWYEKANEFKDVCSKILGYDLWMKKAESNQNKMKLADEYFMDKSLKRVIKSLQKLKNAEQSLQFVQDKIMLKHYMQIWQLSHRSKQFSVRNNNIMKISIRKWLNRIQCATSKCKIAYRFRERHEIQIAFTRFKNEYDRRQHYNEGLEERGDQLIKRKSFKIFLHTFELRKLLRNVLIRNEYNSQRKYMEIWKRRTNQIKLADDIRLSQLVRKSNQIISMWHKNVILEQLLTKHNTDKLRKQFILKWRLATKYKVFMRNTDKLLKLHKLEIWKSNSRDLQRANHFRKTKMLQNTYTNLTKIYGKINKMQRNSALLCEYHLKRNTLLQMKIFENKKVVLMGRQQRFVKVKYWKIIKDIYDTDIALKNLEATSLSAKLSRLLLKRYFRIWMENYQDVREIKLTVIENEVTKIMHDHLKKRFLKTLLFAVYAIEADKTYERSLKLNVYLKWLVNSESLKENERQLTTLLAKQKIRHHYLLWKEHSKKVNQLNIILDNKKSTLSSHHLHKYLQIWSNRLKNNSSLIEKIQLRWSRALLRGCLQSWKEKSKNRGSASLSDELDTAYKTPHRENVRKYDVLNFSDAKYRQAMRTKKIASPIKASSVLESVLKRRVDNPYKLTDENATQMTIENGKEQMKKIESSISKLAFSDVPQLTPNDARLRGSPGRRA
ncbi:uncharacterized protein HLK63_D05995 [Nakaseomyces glabratus]|nr:spindle pole body protein Sfi1 [Nakaseomyces glabratus]KTA99178.1 Protein SFI1 [Nakaseomyces glabratus]KTB15450.1 Protein SFI1 [Nakaseomyces glabratus]UCS19640.1 uncharacterized protein GW608_D05995 [Nakaseomyces glabratus]UCS24873.1 uncharacterized protein HLK63_D05995 [Nakaseomyces glabratus]